MVMIMRTCMLLAGLAALLPAGTAQAADGLKRACSTLACVEIWPVGGNWEVGHQMRVRVTNTTQHSLRPFNFDVVHRCGGGTDDVRTYAVTSRMPPGEQRVLAVNAPVCVGNPQAPAGIRLEQVPGLAIAPVAVGPVGAGAAGAPLVPLPPDPFVRSGCGPLFLCAPGRHDCSGFSLPSGGGGGGDDGEACLILGAIAAVAVLVVAVSAMVLVAGALAGMAVSWLAAELTDREGLEWWQAIIFMDGPLALGVGAALVALLVGSAVVVGLSASLPTAGLVGVVALTTLAAGSLVLLGGALGSAAIFGATMLMGTPRSQDTVVLDMQDVPDNL